MTGGFFNKQRVKLNPIYNLSKIKVKVIKGQRKRCIFGEVWNIPNIKNKLLPLSFIYDDLSNYIYPRLKFRHLLVNYPPFVIINAA